MTRRTQATGAITAETPSLFEDNGEDEKAIATIVEGSTFELNKQNHDNVDFTRQAEFSTYASYNFPMGNDNDYQGIHNVDAISYDEHLTRNCSEIQSFHIFNVPTIYSTQHAINNSDSNSNESNVHIII
jgi:hypothetical protein